MSEHVPRTEFDINLSLRGPDAEHFYQEALRRGRIPADLMADLISVIVQDKLYAAILDE